MRWFLGLAGFCLMLSVPFACGGDDDDDDDNGGILHATCPDLCSAAQAASCTVVDCDCGQFCTSLEAFKSKGGCDATANAYEDCALRQTACTVSSNCASQENAFSLCVAQFCASNPTDSDCVFLNTC